MAVSVTSVERLPNDILRVTGSSTLVNGTLVAQGWFSALTNYYPPAAYDGGGNLIPGSVPRVRTVAERLAYFRGLLIDAEAAAAAGAPQGGVMLNPDGT